MPKLIGYIKHKKIGSKKLKEKFITDKKLKITYKYHHRTKKLTYNKGDLYDPDVVKYMNDVPKSSNIPIYVIGYNNYTFVKNTIDQFIQMNIHKIIIIDNASFYPKLIEYYDVIDNKQFGKTNVKIIRMDKNYGHCVFYHEDIWKQLPKYFVLTDPDLQYNQNMPQNFLQILAAYTVKNKCKSALDLKSNPSELDNSICYEPYKKYTDTTFSLYNKKYNYKGKHFDAMVFNKIFDCVHIPWILNFKEKLQDDEYEYMINGNVASSSFVPIDVSTWLITPF